MARKFGSVSENHVRSSIVTAKRASGYADKVVGCTIESFRNLVRAERSAEAMLVHFESSGGHPDDVQSEHEKAEADVARARNVIGMCLRAQGFAGVRRRQRRR